MTSVTRDSRRRDNQWLGVGLYLIALMAVVAISMLVKHTSDRVPVQQLLFFRFSICLLPILLIGKLSGEQVVLKTTRYRDHLVRSVTGMCSIGLYFVAVSLIPLAAATALSYSVPIFCVVLSIPLLGEFIGIRRWAAVLIGFVGVLIISWPGAGVFNLGALAGIGSAIGGALVVIYLRKLSDTERALTSSLIYNGCGTIVFAVMCVAVGWVPVQPSDYSWMIAIGLLAGVQQFCFASAFRFAEATYLAPFEYMTLVMAALGGFLIWGEVPTLAVWTGGVIITCAGLFMLHRKSVNTAATTGR